MLELMLYPSKILSQRAEEVPAEELTGDALTKLQELIVDMRDTMLHYGGMGLAANQVGVLKRIVVLQLPSDATLLALINPVITACSMELRTDPEGCLSFPGVMVPMERSARITVTFVDETGTLQEALHFEGLAAVAIQHEVDHLDGKTMVSDLSPLKRRFALKKLQKLKKRFSLTNSIPAPVAPPTAPAADAA